MSHQHEASQSEAPADPRLEHIRATVAGLIRASASPPERMSVRWGDVSVELSWSTGRTAAAVAEAVPEPAGRLHVCAPMIGTFYHAPEPGAPPFVSPGDLVEPGKQVGIIESMKLMNPVEAEVRGRVVAFLQPDGAPVEYGQPLIELEPLEGVG